MWHERVKCRLGGSNQTFLAAEGSSALHRILGATCRSASGGKGVPDQLPVKCKPVIYVARESQMSTRRIQSNVFSCRRLQRSP